MRRFAQTFTVIMILSWLFMLSAPTGMGEDEKKVKCCFADYDGDGINDNAPDEDGDGIPDNADPDYIVVETEQSGLINFQAALGSPAVDDALLTNYDRFGKRKFSARALCKNRCGFTSGDEFGGDIGIGISSGGGGCAGGICK